MWHRPSERERTPPTLVGHAACDAMQPHDCPHARLVRVELDERRRQLERRQALQSQQEMAELVADLLEVLDTAEAAVRHQMTGAELLRTQLDRVLGRHGVERVDPDGGGPVARRVPLEGPAAAPGARRGQGLSGRGLPGS
jgi:hypothetical protein